MPNLSVHKKPKYTASRQVGAFAYTLSWSFFWTMDFMTSLLEDTGYNSVLICVDKLVKLTKLLPCYVGVGGLSLLAIIK